MMRIPVNILGWADKLAVSASTVCALHCLGLPVALVAFPAIGGTFLGDEAFHFWLIWAVVPMSLFSLSLGCYRHKTVNILYAGFAGVLVLLVAAILGHELLGENAERFATLIGALLLAFAHINNYRLCRRSNCNQ